MNEINEYIAELYNEQQSCGGVNYKDMQEKIFDRFGEELSINAISGRIRRMKSNGTLDYVNEEASFGDGDVDILEELEKESGEFLECGVLDIETTGLWADFGYVLVAVIKNVSTGEYDIFRLDECKNYKNLDLRADPRFWKRVDQEILKGIVEAYKKYDIIIHFNGRNFDIKFLNTRLTKNRLTILPQMKQLDIFQIAKHRMRLRSKKLDALKEFLEIDEAEKGHKWEYWQMAANGQKAGFDYVVDHCKRDVDRLGEVAKRMKVYINYIKQ